MLMELPNNNINRKMETKTKLSYVLKKLIDSLGIRPKDFSREIQMPYATLLQLIQDENIVPKVNTLRPIAKYFNITIDQLIGDMPLNTEKQAYTDSKNDVSIPWNFKLYIDCVDVFHSLVKKREIFLGSDKALHIIREIYMYSLDKNLKTPDKQFAEWFFKHNFEA